MPLKRSFFDRKTDIVAREILGKIIVKKENNISLFGKIVETEAYLGEDDPAAHAFAGRTKRTEVLYGLPGHAYVFRLRAYYCLNIVAESENSPGCVLIRALEPLEGFDLMVKRRGVDKKDLVNLCNGPGKLCQAFNINLNHYGCDLTNSDSELFIIENENERIEIITTPRIGISKATDWNQRYIIKSNPYISKYKF
ncbi:DNA-3-methyladenine glycosylase [Candidatus Woesearchaeota archaeon]|nr:DNA-3-methyladenine glycosylase [Candidatus Woesearchaeota archaeon]